MNSFNSIANNKNIYQIESNPYESDYLFNLKNVFTESNSRDIFK